MASFTGVGDNVTLQMADKGEAVAIALSGTYNMTILFQREVGSPGSGAYVTLKTYSTANATVADLYITESYNEKLRLIVSVDTSGTATATLTDSALEDQSYLGIKDRLGNKVVVFDQGGVRIQKGFSAGAPVTVAAATFTVTPEHAGRLIVLDLAAGIAVTLPNATGTGNVYRFFIKTTFTGASSIKSSRSADVMVGHALMGNNSDNTVVDWQSLASSTNDTIDLLGTANSTGGIEGQEIELIDAGVNLWAVSIRGDAAGTEATPFANTV